MVSLIWHIQIKTILVDSFCFNLLWLLSGTSNWSQLAIQAGLVKNLTFEQWHILDILWKKKWKKTHVGCAVLLLPAVNRAALLKSNFVLADGLVIKKRSKVLYLVQEFWLLSDIYLSSNYRLTADFLFQKKKIEMEHCTLADKC